MKITSIDVILVTCGRPGRIGDSWNPTVVRINTDEGISGFGEVGLVYGKARTFPKNRANTGNLGLLLQSVPAPYRMTPSPTSVQEKTDE